MDWAGLRGSTGPSVVRCKLFYTWPCRLYLRAILIINHLAWWSFLTGYDYDQVSHHGFKCGLASVTGCVLPLLHISFAP